MSERWRCCSAKGDGGHRAARLWSGDAPPVGSKGQAGSAPGRLLPTVSPSAGSEVRDVLYVSKARMEPAVEGRLMPSLFGMACCVVTPVSSASLLATV